MRSITKFSLLRYIFAFVHGIKMKLEESSFSRLVLLEAAVLSVSNIVDLLIYVM
jgi:hypothetical protein